MKTLSEIHKEALDAGAEAENDYWMATIRENPSSRAAFEAAIDGYLVYLAANIYKKQEIEDMAKAIHEEQAYHTSTLDTGIFYTKLATAAYNASKIIKLVKGEI